MSLTGKAAADKLLRGKISKLDAIYTDAYELAVRNGFEGTVEEWLASIKGEKGDKGESALVCLRALDPYYQYGAIAECSLAYLNRKPEVGEVFTTICAQRYYTVFRVTEVLSILCKAQVIHSSEITTETPRPATLASVQLPASAWIGSGKLYSQVVQIDGVTENSQVDLTPSVEQLAIFYEKSLALVAENEDGVVTVYAIGQKPENDYTIQVTLTEVNV